jgi:hypothetical protein
MTVDEALKQIVECAEKMRVRYGGRTVFDEWAIVAFSQGRGRILTYVGPRREGFKSNFAADASGILSGLMKDSQQVGDFEFSRNAVGTGFESYMVVGQGIFLICNNTVHSMDTIAADPQWLSAQVPFVELSETFRSDWVEP